MLKTVFASLTAVFGGPVSVANEHPVEITGVVSAMGARASKGPTGTPWTGVFNLVAWREGSGPVILEELRIEKFLGYDDNASKRWVDELLERSTIRMQVIFEEKGTLPRRTARFVQYLGAARDPELEAATQPILNPPDFVDPVLGRFKADNTLVDMFEKPHKWQQNDIELSLTGNNPTELAKAAEVARLLVENQSTWQAKAEESIKSDLYELWLDVWRGEKPMLSEAEFVTLARLESISIEHDGTFTFWFDDGDLFWGHTISASGDLDTGFVEASISG